MHDRPPLGRVLKAWLLAALTGGVIIGLTQYAVLPAVARRLTQSQLVWLRGAFLHHPAGSVLAVLVLAAILGLPVLLVALWASRQGPWRDRTLMRH